ncbi:LPS assembly lipoprotein LptE [Candidatus Rariloculus sp.]|uniref:LPS-assembly lipoprotein LptE n=1 Tax=Candidatus Rariloculus sp. TaxID=3101265 RepID=UPI003D10A141
MAVALALGMSLTVAGCGFQLEGSGALPSAMEQTYVDAVRPSSEFLGSLREVLRRRGLEVVSDAGQAGATLVITEDSTGQRVLSVSARNIPREYEIYYAVTFSLRVGSEPLVESESLVLTRGYTYDETQVLGKSQEEEVLRAALAEDLALQVVRRIEAIGARASL